MRALIVLFAGAARAKPWDLPDKGDDPHLLDTNKRCRPVFLIFYTLLQQYPPLYRFPARQISHHRDRSQHRPCRWSLVPNNAAQRAINIRPRLRVRAYAHLLPEEIASFTTAGVYDEGDNQHLSFIQGAGHGGSHPHLVHEFLTSLVEERDPYPNARQSANITCVGILAHESAMNGGEIKRLPEFTVSS